MIPSRSSQKPRFSDREACSVWQGSPEHYQEQAALALIEAGRRLWPWSWIEPACGEYCLTPAHLFAYEPRSLDYPSGVCVYCGGVAWTRDHLVPRTITGDTARRNVLTVPACGACNGLIGDAAVFSITERREVAHAGIRRRKARVLRRFEYTDAELREFGPGLRPTIREGLAEKREVERQLSWPTDPSYDMRALQRSGIDDPYALGLLKGTL